MRSSAGSKFRLLGNAVTLKLIHDSAWHDQKYAEIEQLIPELEAKNEELPVLDDEESRFTIRESNIPTKEPMKGIFFK